MYSYSWNPGTLAFHPGTLAPEEAMRVRESPGLPTCISQMTTERAKRRHLADEQFKTLTDVGVKRIPITVRRAVLTIRPKFGSYMECLTTPMWRPVIDF